MRINVKTGEKIEKSFFADILMELFGIVLLSIGIRIRMLFRHNWPLDYFYYRVYLEAHFVPDNQKFPELLFHDKRLNWLPKRTKFKEQILINGMSSIRTLGGRFINRYLSLENIFLCWDSYVFLEKCYITELSITISLQLTFPKEAKN